MLRFISIIVLPFILVCTLFPGCEDASDNLPPSIPDIIRGTDSVQVDQLVEVWVVAVDPEGGLLNYEIDWGDGRQIEHMNRVESGLYYPLRSHYFDPGVYSMRCRVADDRGRYSAWSEPFAVTVGGVAVVGKGDWWMFMRDAQHSGHSPFAGPLQPRLAWTVNTGSPTAPGAPIRSSVSYDASGTLYFGANNFLLYARYPNSRTKWLYFAGNARISDVPAIDSDGAVVFGSSSANIYRVNRYGSKEWNYSVSAPIIRSSPALDSEGRIYIGGQDGVINCLSQNGTVLWQAFTSGAVEGSPALSRDESTVYAGSTDQVLYAFDRNGNELWTFAADAPITGSPSVGPGGGIYFGSTGNTFYALRPDGTLRWRRTLHTPIETTPAVTREGILYVATSGGQLFCIANDGTTRWDTRFASAGGLGSPVVDVLGTAYIGSPDGFITAINATGRIVWKFDTEAPIHATASIGPDGAITIGNDDGRLFVLRER
jgi:outer membrane protein assembly factor BamB